MESLQDLKLNVNTKHNKNSGTIKLPDQIALNFVMHENIVNSIYRPITRSLVAGTSTIDRGFDGVINAYYQIEQETTTEQLPVSAIHTNVF